MKMPVETYPLIVSVGVAVGLSGYVLKKKWADDPQITLAKGRRSGGLEAAYDGIEEAKPFWSGTKTWPNTIFGERKNIIMEYKMRPSEIYEVNVPKPAGDDEEEEVEEAPEPVVEVIEAAPEPEPETESAAPEPESAPTESSDGPAAPASAS